MRDSSNHRTDIQSLRGLSVLAVVAFHAKENFFQLGFLGVDVFFVISGFVVTPLILRIFTEPGIHGSPIVGLKTFYIRRFWRLAPALIASLTLSALGVFFLISVSEHEKFALQGIFTLLIIGNLGAYKFSGDYFSPNPNPLVHTWSLSVEEQIYIFLPLLILVIMGGQKKLKKIIIPLFSVLSLASFTSFLFPGIMKPIYLILGFPQAAQFSFYSTLDRTWQFTLGGLGYFLFKNLELKTNRLIMVLKLVSLIGLILILLAPVSINLKTASILASCCAFFVILLRSFEIIPRFAIQGFSWLGDRSYSIYLIHMPLLYIAKNSHVIDIGSDSNRILQSTIAVAFSLLLGSISYTRIEKRFRESGRYAKHDLRKTSSALILFLVIPFLVFFAMKIGSKNHYWGLDRNSEKSIAAWDLDPSCARMSLRSGPCIYNEINSKKLVLLIGDSHAGAISQAVVDAAKNQKWNSGIWTKSDCMIQFEQGKQKKVLDECLKQNNEIRKWVEIYSPTTIIISQYVQSNSSQEELRKSLLSLKSLVPRLLLIENNPVFPDKNDFGVSRPVFMSPYDPPRSFPIREMQIRDRDASDKLAAWARANGIETINFYSLFCNPESCLRYSNVGWLYSDDDHLSTVGARLTIPLLEKYLEKF